MLEFDNFINRYICAKHFCMSEKELLELLDSWDNFEITIMECSKHSNNFKLLMKIALYSKTPKSWRAAYIADRIHDKIPELLLPYLNDIIVQLKDEKNNGKKRHFLKLISLNNIETKHHGFLVEYCINAFTSAKEAIAVRVHAMQILFNISEKETELKPEILAIIEHEMEYHSTAGILSRGSKLAKKLHKQIE